MSSESKAEQIKTANALARKYTGEFAVATIILLSVSVAGFAVTAYGFYNNIISEWMTIILLGTFTYFSYTPLHEAVHNNINGKQENLRWLNNLCGYIGGQLIGVSYTSHRVEYLDHHSNTNHPDKDPDFIVSEFSKGPLHILIAGTKFLLIQNTYLARKYWSDISSKDRIIYGLELATNIIWRAALIWLLSTSTSISLLGAFVVVILGYYLGAFFTAYWFAYRPHHPYKHQGRFINTASLIFPRGLKFMEGFWLGQNIHSIHHLYPRVPFYRYKALHTEIEPIMRENGTPIIGIFSRRPQ